MLLWHLLTPLEIWNTSLLLSFLQFSGQRLVFGPALLEQGKRWRVSPLTALAECDLVFSSLWGRRGCYLPVQQRNLGCHFARHQQRPRADSVSRVRSQVQPESSAGRGGYGNEASQRQETTEQRLDWSALAVTHNIKKWQSHSGVRTTAEYLVIV